MLSLKKMFSGVQTLLGKYNKAKKQETRDKYYDEIKTKLDTRQIDKVFKEDLERQKNEQKQKKQLQKKLDAALKRQKKLDKERARQDTRLRRISRQQVLSSRLLSDDERKNLLIRKYNQALSQEELRKINKKLKDDKLEQARRKKFDANKITKKMKKLAEKFAHLNDEVGNVYTKMNDMTTRRGGILVRDIFVKNQRKVDFSYFLDAVEPAAISILKGFATSKKVQLKIHFTMVRYSLLRNEVIERVEKIFSTQLKVMFHATDLKELYDGMKNDLISKWVAIQIKNSGWELESIEKLQVFVYNYTPYSSFRKNQGNVKITGDERGGTPYFDIGKFWRGKEGMIVPQNKGNDENCFLYACAIAKYLPEKNPGRITRQLKKDIKKFNIEGVNLPPTKEDIRKFEKLNNMKILCVCAQTDGRHVEIYKEQHNPDIILMLMKNPKGESHLCVVPTPSSLVSLTSANLSKSKKARFICTNCLHFTCTTFNELKTHEKYCLLHEAQTTKLPTKRDLIMFRNERKKIRPPVSIYADFECYQPQTKIKKGKSSEIVSKHIPSGVGIGKSSEIVSKHIPSGVGIYVKSRYEEKFPSKYSSFTAENEDDDVPKEFIKDLIKIRDEYGAIPPCEIHMTVNDNIKHEQATRCYLCHEEFTEEDYKVRDHDHHNGFYRGALHNSCNLKLQDERFIPVFFHNLKGYDSHIFMNAFHDLEETPNVIPQNEEKFVSFSLMQKKGIELRFLDTMAFMNDSMANLAENLKHKPIMQKVFGKEMAKDLSRKGVFPYEWFDCLEN